MSDGFDRPNTPPKRPDPLPDEMKGSPIRMQLPTGEVIVTGYTILRPNDPAPPREPVKDMRPDRLLEVAGFESAEEWGNSILSKNNGDKHKLPGPLDQFSLPPEERS